jgi:hypothetical protein
VIHDVTSTEPYAVNDDGCVKLSHLARTADRRFSDILSSGRGGVQRSPLSNGVLDIAPAPVGNQSTNVVGLLTASPLNETTISVTLTRTGENLVPAPSTTSTTTTTRLT